MDICDMPLIMWAGRTLGNGDSEADKRAYEIIEYLIKKGEPLNDRYGGMTVVHEAILFRQPKYLKMLLDAGADPKITIDRKDKKSHGLDAFAFVEFLERINSGGFRAIKEVLDVTKG
jgi:ankyrin repeat protein